MKYRFLAGFLLLLFAALGSSSTCPYPVGDTCYERLLEIPFRVEEVFIHLVLHNDSSLSYSLTVGMVHDFGDLIVDEKGVMNQTFALPPDSTIWGEINVTDTLTGQKFRRTYVLENYSDGQFVFNRSSNTLKVYFKPRKQIAFKIESRILSPYSVVENNPDSDYIVSPTIPFGLSEITNEYPVFLVSEGDSGVRLMVEGGACKNSSGLTFESFALENGIICKTNLSPSDNYILFTMTLGGEDVFRKEARELKKLKELELAYLNTSINASLRSAIANENLANETKTLAEETKNLSRFTFILVLATVVAALIAVWESKKSSDALKEEVKQLSYRITNLSSTINSGLNNIAVKHLDVFKKLLENNEKSERKLELFKKYIRKEPFDKPDLEWMDRHDWHPVDEKQMNKKFVKETHETLKKLNRK
ncbi:MAG: hypothetical protein ABIH83_00930 [Candidatus Micrarchaeota archaeon]